MARRKSKPADQAKVLARGATLACGVCGRRGLFRRWVYMTETCPRCGLRFEREEGDFVGAVGINTVLTFGILLVGMVTFFVVTYPDIPAGPGVFVAALLFVPVPVFLYPFSKTLWLAIGLIMRPVEAGEVKDKADWV
ncbi:MAG: DUF983 domain-containing protein [Acidimicrobiales bacterium]